MLQLEPKKKRRLALLRWRSESFVEGTVNRARFLLHFYRLKNEGPSGEDKEMNRKNAQKLVYKTYHYLFP